MCLSGQGRELCHIGRALLSRNVKVSGVCTYAPACDQTLTPEQECEAEHGLYESLNDFAVTSRLPVFHLSSLNSPDAEQWLSDHPFDLLFSFRTRHIFSKAFTSQHSGKLLNAHIGHLPAYRGSGAMSWMILNGETKTALTIHQIDKGVDTGAVIEQIWLPIAPTDYPIDIFAKASSILIETAPDVIQRCLNGQATSTLQDETRASYYPRLNTMRDGKVLFTYSPVDFERFVRAFGWPYGGAHCYFGDKQIHLGRVQISPDTSRYHPFVNGLILTSDPARGAVSVVTNSQLVEILTVRRGNKEIPAMEVLRTGQRLF